MAKLTAKKRNSLKQSSFAEPGKRAYPINDANHARNALARVSQHGTSAEKAQVRAAVKRKYPGIGKKDKPTPGDTQDKSETGRIAAKMGIKRIGGSGGDMADGGMNMPLADDSKGKTHKAKRGKPNGKK